MSFKSGIVDIVERFEEPPAEGLLVDAAAGVGVPSAPATFKLRREDKTFALRPDDKHFDLHADIVRSRAGTDRPIYVEFEDDGEQVSRVLVPRVRRIAEVFDVQGGLAVRAEASPTRFLLPRGRSDQDSQLLREAAQGRRDLLVTEDPDTHEILDVQLPFVPARLTAVPAEPMEAPTILTLEQAQRAFELLAGQTHIPFDYPDDCCTTRAHEMFRLLLRAGIRCRKIWSYGAGGDFRHTGIRFFTSNHPDGVVGWLFHVAPLVLVELPSRIVVEMVLDPVMFDRPARVPDWIALQHDCIAVQEITEPEIFFRWVQGAEQKLDVNFIETDEGMAEHRRESLRRRITLAP